MRPINLIHNNIKHQLRTINTLQLVLLVVLCVIYSSCEKESLLKPDNSISMAEENPHRKYLREVNLDNQILSRGTKYSMDQALDYLNDGMNFLYCRPNDYFLETAVYKDSFYIPIASNQIDEDDLVGLMDDIAIFAGDNFHGETRTEKAPFMFNMREIYSSVFGYKRIEATFTMEVGLPPTTIDEYPYNDSWIYGQFGSDVSGSCSEEGANFDAADLFRRDLKKNVAYRNKYDNSYYFKNPYAICFSSWDNNCESAEIAWWTWPIADYHEGQELINEEDVTENDNYYDYLLFYNTNACSGYHSCLDVSEMNFYYESMADLATATLPSPVGNTVIAQVEVGYELLLGSNSHIFHSMLVVKATKVPIIEEEDHEPQTLPTCCP